MRGSISRCTTEMSSKRSATISIVLASIFLATIHPARPHDIYSGVRGKGGVLCCGGSDCAVTLYRERGDHFDFLTRENKWVEIPKDRITFLPIPGDNPEVDDAHRAHLCYRLANDFDRQSSRDRVFDDIFLYCAFIPPGAT